MNMRLRTVLLGVCFSALAVSAMAQVSIGRLYPPSVSVLIGGSGQAPYTYVDIMHPATASGSVGKAVVRWANAPFPPCTSAFKLKFLRQTGIVGFFSTMVERGPFPAANGRNEVVFTQVNVIPGDLIAVTQINPSQTCGAV